MAILEAFKGAETEHGFSPVQIILLLELADTENICTYSLPEEENISDESYILAAQDLVSRGFIEYAQGNKGGLCGFRLTEKAQELFRGMFHPVRVLEVISAWTGTIPALVYRGSGSVCTVSRWDSASGYIGISRLDCGRIGEWLEEEGFLPEQPFETVREARKALQYDPQMEESRGRIRQGLICHPQEPPALWAMQENVRSAIRSMEIPSKGTDTGQKGFSAQGEGGEGMQDPAQAAPGAGGSCLYVFLETDTGSWVLTDTEEDEAEPVQEREMENEEKAGSDAHRRWSFVPDSVEYRRSIWRRII